METDLHVDADPLRVGQALVNLVDNALTHGGGTVELRAEERDGLVELHVRDAGSGFPPEFRSRAFDRFSRADGARSGGGSGLGLSIVELVAGAHGGARGLSEPPAGGADVWISLPPPISRSARRLHRRGSGKTPGRAGRGSPKRPSREGFDAIESNHGLMKSRRLRADAAAPLRLNRTTRAAVLGVLGDDRSAVRLGHLADDRQPEPGAGHRACRRRAIEALEDERPVLVGESRARGRARRSSPPASETSTEPPSPLHLPAFSSRFQTARSIRSR